MCHSLVLKDGLFGVDAVIACASSAAAYIQNRMPENLYTEEDFGAFIAAGKLVAQASTINQEVILAISGGEVRSACAVWLGS